MQVKLQKNFAIFRWCSF